MASRCIIAVWETDLWLFCLQTAHASTFPVNFMWFVLINHQEWFINHWMTSTGHVSSPSKVTCLALSNVFPGTRRYLYLIHPQYCKQNTASTPLSYHPLVMGVLFIKWHVAVIAICRVVWTWTWLARWGWWWVILLRLRKAVWRWSRLISKSGDVSL